MPSCASLLVQGKTTAKMHVQAHRASCNAALPKPCHLELTPCPHQQEQPPVPRQRRMLACCAEPDKAPAAQPAEPAQRSASPPPSTPVPAPSSQSKAFDPMSSHDEVSVPRAAPVDAPPAPPAPPQPKEASSAASSNGAVPAEGPQRGDAKEPMQAGEATMAVSPGGPSDRPLREIVFVTSEVRGYVLYFALHLPARTDRLAVCIAVTCVVSLLELCLLAECLCALQRQRALSVS